MAIVHTIGKCQCGIFQAIDISRAVVDKRDANAAAAIAPEAQKTLGVKLNFSPRIILFGWLAIRRNGRQLRLQRQLVPMETRDGRCVVIPIEHVELSAHDGQLYQ